MDAIKTVSRSRWIWSCCLGFAFLGLSACVASPVVKQSAPVSIEPGAEQNAWEAGIRAFWSGDYKLAGEVFEALSQTAGSDEFRRKSLYAAASAMLAAAKTPEEFKGAMDEWERWSSQVPIGSQGEDPRLLTPLLHEVSAHLFQSPEKGDASPDQVRRALKDAAAGGMYKNMLQTKEKEVENLRARLEQREKEVRRLRHQLESLEEIHRKYQEKKQEATAP